jgi:hypothetical protein
LCVRDSTRTLLTAMVSFFNLVPMQTRQTTEPDTHTCRPSVRLHQAQLSTDCSWCLQISRCSDRNNVVRNLKLYDGLKFYHTGSSWAASERLTFHSDAVEMVRWQTSILAKLVPCETFAGCGHRSGGQTPGHPFGILNGTRTSVRATPTARTVPGDFQTTWNAGPLSR